MAGEPTGTSSTNSFQSPGRRNPFNVNDAEFRDTPQARTEFRRTFSGLAKSLNYDGEWQRQLPSDVSKVSRVPVMLTTEEMITQNRYIIMWCNPTTVQWNLKMRGVTQETKGGIVQHYFKDRRRNTFFDEPEMQITFQTGNIMPVRVTERSRSTNVGADSTLTYLPHGLLNLYEFIELLDQKKVMSDGRTNYVYMLYSSLAFPKIILRGFFPPDAGLSFQESAMENAEIQWATSFRIVGSYPKFNSANSLAQTWRYMQQVAGFDVAYDSDTAFTSPPSDEEPTGASASTVGPPNSPEFSRLLEDIIEDGANRIPGI